jgi:hypothetical protein
MLPVKSPECDDATIGQCLDRAIFRPEISESWNYTGNFSSPEEWSIPNSSVTSNKSMIMWGMDRVDFGNIAIQDFGIAEQFILEITSRNFFVGIFGLSVGMVKPESSSQTSSLLSVAAASKAIPSRSFSYTAGSAQSTYSW